MTDKTPRIVAALCWYDEPAEPLERCIKSLAGFADTLVSLDGAYKHFPHKTVHSPKEQHDNLTRITAKHGIKHKPIAATDTPLTQAEKRTRLYRAAVDEAGSGGWILIIDADEELSHKGALETLARSGHVFDSASVMIRDDTGDTMQPRLVKAIGQLTCGSQYHGMLSATDIDGRRVCIRDKREIIISENPRPRIAHALDLSTQISIFNHHTDRDAARKKQKKRYIGARMRAGVDL